MQKIMILGPNATEGGGIVTLTQGLLTSQLREQFEFSVFNISKGSRVGAGKLFMHLLYILQLFWHLLAHRYDIVHIHVSSGDRSFASRVILLPLLKLFGMKTILHFHGAFKSYKRLTSAWPSPGFKLVDAVITVSGEWEQFFHRGPWNLRWYKIPNLIEELPVEIQSPDAHANESLTLVYLGLLSEGKGIYVLLAALKSIHLTTDLRIRLAGAIPAGETARLESELAVLQNHLSIELSGKLTPTEKYSFLSTGDIFVFPSMIDSFGIVNLEAMAVGLPVVASRIGAVPEYVEDNVNGLLVPPGDAEALSAAINEMLVNPEMRVRMADENRQKIATKYTWKTGWKAYANLYTELGR